MNTLRQHLNKGSFEQRQRQKALLGVIAVSCAMILWLSFGAQAGYLSWIAVAASLTWGTLVFSVALLMQRTGLNQRFKDPSMTLPIVIAASVCVLGVAHGLETNYRAAVLPWMTMAFAFAAFRSRIRNVLGMATVVSSMILIESASYIHAHGQFTLLAWQTAVIVGSIFCTGAYFGVLNDAQAAASKKLSLNKTVLNSIAEAVVSLDLDGRILELNRAAERLIDIDKERAVGKSMEAVLLPAAAADAAILNKLTHWPQETDEQLRARIQCRLNRDAELIELECSASIVRDHRGAAVGWVVVLRDVSEAGRLARQLEYSSNHDELTRLLNRRGFETALSASLLTFRAYPERTRHAALIIDLDQFKVVNETCGHAAGDALLREVSKQLRGAVRSIDVVSRYAGDEFAIILHGVTSQTALEIAESILRSIGNLQFESGGRRFPVAASIGCTMFDEYDNDIVKVIRKAESALLLAKDLGRGRVQMYSDGDELIAKRSSELEWACRINEALDSDALQIYAQRVSYGNSEQEDHFEILVRMLESDGAIIEAVEFIPSAERFGLMPALDRWVVQNTLAMLEAAVEGQHEPPKVAINVSAQSINDRDFLPFLLGALHHSRVASKRICFELTEAVTIANFDTAKIFVESVRALGCTFAIDGVGAGFKSFNYLKLLTFDTIKIDGNYIRNFQHDAADRSLVESLVQAAASLELTTVAEMVENDATAIDLRKMGVDQLQGFGIHRPEPFGAVLRGMQHRLGLTEPLPGQNEWCLI